MIKMIFLGLLSVAAFGEITMDQGQIQKMGIKVEHVRYLHSGSMGPFIGMFDYGDEHVYSYTLSTEATVVNVVKKPGDTVKKGEIICHIASAELLNNTYELKDIEQRLKLAREYAKKDETLYKEGVISLRESQKSALEVMSLNAKASEVKSKFTFAGADLTPSDGMMFTIRAKRSGIISSGAFNGGEKIEPFVSYLKIADSSGLNALISIPPKMMNYVQKGAEVSDKEGNVIGTVSAVSMSVNRKNNSGTAKVRIVNPAVSYRAGTSAELFIRSVKKIEWILLPRTAVTKYKHKDICFIRTAKGFEPKEISVQKYFKDHIAVASEGFTPQSQVVNGGIITLKGALCGMGFE